MRVGLWLSLIRPSCIFAQVICSPLSKRIIYDECPGAHLDGHLLPGHGLLQFVVHECVVDAQAAEDGERLS